MEVNAIKISELLSSSALFFLLGHLYNLFDGQNFRENRSKN